MEIVNLVNDTYQVVSTSNGTVLYQGNYDDCVGYMKHIEQQEFEAYFGGL